MTSSISFIERDWVLSETAWFRRPTDEFGGFSNMSPSYPLQVFGIRVQSSEHLYQALRFSHRPDIQQEILNAESPMSSKQVSRQHDSFTRPDWLEIRVEAMRWALRVKLAQHRDSMGKLLHATGQRPVVEWSRHDSFRGAGPVTDDLVHGRNVLGQLLSELRDDDRNDPAEAIPAPAFPGARLLGIEIGVLRESGGPPLITAEDLRDAGLPAGPAFGPVLKACLQKQWNGEFTDRDGGLQVALQIFDDHTRMCER